MQLAHRRTWLFATTCGALAILLAVAAAQSAARGPYNSSHGVALNGYDVVAYFTDGRPTKGSAAHVHVWQGTAWWFATAAHREAFIKDPDRYAPQFGGFCAYGVSRGYAVDIDPEAWSIVDDRLFLNYSRGVQRTWDKNRALYIERAVANWPAIAAKQSSQE